MLNRNDEKSERIMASLRSEFGADVKASYITMDLSDLASVKAASKEVVKSVKKGAYPSVMCATKDGLDQRALYGPTGFIEFIDPVGKGTLKPHAYDKDVMVELWSASEKATGFSWGI